jgi:hypothetical protein
MFMRYASDHMGDCYSVCNPKTKMVSETHDVVFHNRIFFKAPMDTKGAHKEQKQPDLDERDRECLTGQEGEL